jgi:hypothetical protein
MSVIEPITSSYSPCWRPCWMISFHARRLGAVPRSALPRNSIRWSNVSPWNASMPEPSNRQRGTFRSWSSGYGLRRSAMHWAPDSMQFAHSFTDAMPDPTTM